MAKQLKRFEFEDDYGYGSLSAALEEAAAWVKEHYRLADGDVVGTPDVLVQHETDYGWSVVIYAAMREERD